MRDSSSLPLGVIKASPVETHRRQMVRQVWIPLIATLVIVLALVILAVIGTVQGSDQVNRWGNISALIVIIPLMIQGLLLLALYGGIAFGLYKLLKKMPGWMLRLQLLMLRVSLTVRRVADSTTRPVFAVNTFEARATTLWDRIFRRKPSR